MPDTQSSITDNREGNTLLSSLQTVTDSGRELCIASAFFTLDALLLADTLDGYAKIRLLFGGDADAAQRRNLMEKAQMSPKPTCSVSAERSLPCSRRSRSWSVRSRRRPRRG